MLHRGLCGVSLFGLPKNCQVAPLLGTGWNLLNLSLSTQNSLDMSQGCPNLWTSWWAGVKISRWHRDSSITFCLTEPLFLARLAYSIFQKCYFGGNQSRLIVPALGPKWFFQEVILAHVLEQTHFIISMLKVCGRGFCWCHDVGRPCYCAWVWSGPGSAVEGSRIAGVFTIFCLCSVFSVYNLPYTLGSFFNTTSRS